MPTPIRCGFFRFLIRLLLTGGTLSLLPASPVTSTQPARVPGAGGAARQTAGLMNYDLRAHGRALLPEVERGYPAARLDAMRQKGLAWGRALPDRLAGMRHAVPGSSVDLSPLSGGPEMVRSERGFLTAPARGRGRAVVARAFLREHAGTLGMSVAQVDALRLLGESPGGRSGLGLVRLEQRIHDVPVFQGELRAVVDRDGRLVRLVGRLVPGIDETLVPAATGLLSEPEALRQALRSVGLEVDPAALRVEDLAPNQSGAGPAEARVISTDPRLLAPVPSWRVYFPLQPGVVIPAWAQVFRIAGPAAYYTVVDGRTGTLLFRKDMLARASTQAARFSIYARADGRPEDNPAPGTPNTLPPGSGTQFQAVGRRILDMLAHQDTVASPNGWITDGGDTTIGNNADAYLSRHSFLTPDLGTLDRDGRPVGNPDAFGRNRDFLGTAPRDFTYTPAPVGSNPAAGDDPSTPRFQRGAVTQGFYVANFFHDLMYGYGWDEAAGNTQADNFGRGGAQGDPVQVANQYDADLGTGEDAFAICDPDGSSPLVGFAIFNSPTPQRDSVLDTGTVLHELTHTLTCRLVGNGAGLNWGPGQALGEGWSDFYALAILYNRPGDDPSLQYPLSPYIMYGADFGRLPAGTFTDNYVYGIRRFPFTTNNAISPLSWADADGVTYDVSGGIPPSPYRWDNAGASEVHNLGEIWALTLWEVRARIIAAHGGDVTAGNDATLRIVTDALKLTPIDPSLIEARDSLLEADCAAGGCAHEPAIWGGFADRGLGYGAHASRGIATRVGVRESFSVPFLEPSGVTVADGGGNGNGHLDPGETVSLTVTLFNPWRSAARGIAGATATLRSAEPGVTILDATATYGAIPARGSANGEPFLVRLDAGSACGRGLRFEIETTSALGTTRAPYTLRVGRPAGTGSRVTLTRTIPGGLPIPNSSLGVADRFTIGADLEIADLNLVLGELRHTAVGDLTVMLRAPDAFGGDLIWHLSSCSQGFCGIGSNVGDDFLGTIIDDGSKRDLYIAGTRKAPFTGRWLPVFASRRFDAGTDPGGQLVHFNGRGTQGDWHLFVSDVFRPADSGTLRSWSLEVTPVAYSCGP